MSKSKQIEVDLESLLKRLDEWRHYPGYQLERRFDVIFSFFIPEFIKENFDISDVKVIPEFPVPKKLVSTKLLKKDRNKCCSIDFACLGKKDGKAHIFFIEFKTDDNSNRDEQDLELEKLSKLPFKCILVELFEVIKKSTNQEKYIFLLNDLKRLGIIDIDRILFNGRNNIKKNIKALLSYKVIVNQKPEIKIIKIEPKKPIIPDPAILNYSFTDFCECNEKIKPYLENWVASPEYDVWEYLID